MYRNKEDTMGQRYFWWCVMANNKVLKELVKALCSEVSLDREHCDDISNEIADQTSLIAKGIPNNIPSIPHMASVLRVAHERYWCRKRDLLRICEALGDEYLEIYKNILEDN